MNHIPGSDELIEMSLWSLREHVRELVSKPLTEEQRKELAKIGEEMKRGD